MSNFEAFSCVNGQRDAFLSTFDRGLAYGDGLFETMRLERGQLPFWSFHRQRLLGDCRRLQLALDPQLLDDQLQSALALARQRGATRAVVKLIVTRGEAGRGYQATLSVQPSIVVSVFPFPSYPRYVFEEGVAVYLCEHRLPDNPGLAGIKHLNKLDHVLAAMEWRNSGCQEALLFDQRDQLVEASSRNVFVVKNRRLLTPSLHRAGVAGVLRKRIMEEYATQLDWRVAEVSLTLESLLQADEVFLANSVLGVWPVKSLNSKTGQERVFPTANVARQLHDLFEYDIQTQVGRA